MVPAFLIKFKQIVDVCPLERELVKTCPQLPSVRLVKSDMNHWRFVDNYQKVAQKFKKVVLRFLSLLQNSHIGEFWIPLRTHREDLSLCIAKLWIFIFFNCAFSTEVKVGTYVHNIKKVGAILWLVPRMSLERLLLHYGQLHHAQGIK